MCAYVEIHSIDVQSRSHVPANEHRRGLRATDQRREQQFHRLRRGVLTAHVDGNVCHYDVAGIRRHVRRALLAHARDGIVLEMHPLVVVVAIVVVVESVLARRNEMSTWRWAADRACQTPLERRRLPSQKTCDVRGGSIEIDAPTISPGDCGRGTEEGP